jgi:predicted DNA-binding transcriptional regulator AlpA
MTQIQSQQEDDRPRLASPDENSPILVSGPSLRRMLDISVVTLWRWRHDKNADFPTAKLINGRLYFRWIEVKAWLARQRQAS